MDERNFDSGNSEQDSSQTMFETLRADKQRAARVKKLYGASGGPLLGWLREERLRRGETPEQFCTKLGTTPAYLRELWQTPEKVKDISADFARSCGAYFGVPPIVVKVLAGQVTLADFVCSSDAEDEAIDRVQQVLLTKPLAFETDATWALERMYERFSDTGLFGLRWLPGILEWLEPAVQVHFGHATEARLMAISYGQPADKVAGQASEKD